MEAVNQDKTLSSDLQSLYSRVGLRRNQFREDYQKGSSTDSALEKAYPVSKNADSGDVAEDTKGIDTPMEQSDVSLNTVPRSRTEDTLSSSPIKYVLSYRLEDLRFKDQVAKDLESFEPTQGYHQTHKGEVFEVTRVAFVEPLLMDQSKPHEL